jgi:hypothetical protein
MMGAPLPEEAVAYLLTLERALLGGIVSTREALQRAFDAGRMRGRPDGIAIAQDIIAGKEPS